MTAIKQPAAGTSPSFRGHRPWARFLIRRLVRLLVSLAIVTTASFAMIHLIPGDPVRSVLGMRATPQAVAAKRAELGLNKPLLSQYWNFVDHVIHGNFGRSMVTEQSVSQLIAERLPSTLELAGCAFLVVVIVALPVGMGMAVLTRQGRHRSSDLVFNTASGLVTTIPDFLLGVGLVFAFAVTFRFFPVAGKDSAASFVLPVLALAAAPAAALARIVRAETLKVFAQEYATVAHSKRLPRRVLYFRHVLPNTLTATLTVGGLILSGLIGGTVLVENVFAWPGLGSTVASSIVVQDYSVVQAIVLVLAATVLVVNLIVDVLLALIDPRSTIRGS